MSHFKNAEHICSWAGLCPGNNESAGKRKSTSITKGNPYIKSILCEIAWIITGKRNTYLSAWYWRIKQKKGAKKAIVALARKLLVIIYTILKQGTLFDENCFETRRKTVNKNRYPITFVSLKNKVIILKPPPDNSLWTGSYLAALFVVPS